MSRSQSAVLTTLEKTGGFVSAQEVFQLMRKQGKSTGLATVYRALQKAAVENSVDVLRKDDGEALYRLCATGHHHHLVCTGCNKTTEISAPEVEVWTEKIAREQGYVISGHTIEVFGLCKNCR